MANKNAAHPCNLLGINLREAEMRQARLSDDFVTSGSERTCLSAKDNFCR